MQYLSRGGSITIRILKRSVRYLESEKIFENHLDFYQRVCCNYLKITGVYMAVWIDQSQTEKTAILLGIVLSHCKAGNRVQFLADPSAGEAVVQRLRVALSRSRNRNRDRGRLVSEFTLRNSIYPFTKEGKRYDCIVMWTEKNQHHVAREILDDLLERE